MDQYLKTADIIINVNYYGSYLPSTAPQTNFRLGRLSNISSPAVISDCLKTILLVFNSTTFKPNEKNGLFS